MAARVLFALAVVWLPAAASEVRCWLGYRIARILCRAARRHTAYCRGRQDHVRGGKIIDPGRWSR